MKYGLIYMVLGGNDFLEVSKIQADNIVVAKRLLNDVMSLEENFDIIVENYMEFEKECLALTVNFMLRPTPSHSAFQEPRRIVNRRIMNLLTSARSYLDQIISISKSTCQNNNSDIVELKEFISNQYDSSLAYRTMEALRNHVQHRGFPIHGIGYNSKWIENQSRESVLEITITPSLNPIELKAEGGFKAGVLKELLDRNESFDIRPMLREYVSLLDKIHQKFRTLSHSHVKQSEKTINDSISKYSKVYPKSKKHTTLTLIEKSEDNTYEKITALFSEFLLYRQELEIKNRSFNNLQKRYVTSLPFVKD